MLPVPYEICLYDMPSLFAGKIHAVICRGWRSRIKGRDLFYFGSKKAVAYLKENDAEGYRLYHDAITDRTNAAIREWANHVINIGEISA